MESVLITGASGFIGSFIVEEALKRRFGVWAGIRSTSSKKYLKTGRFIFWNWTLRILMNLVPNSPGIKVLITSLIISFIVPVSPNALTKKTFDYVNYLQTKYFIDTLKALNMVPKQFIYISTLSVFGPVREKGLYPIEADDTRRPIRLMGSVN